MKRHVVFDKSKHLDFEASHVRRVRNPVIGYDWIEHDLVMVSRVRAAYRKKDSSIKVKCVTWCRKVVHFLHTCAREITGSQWDPSSTWILRDWPKPSSSPGPALSEGQQNPSALPQSTEGALDTVPPDSLCPCRRYDRRRLQREKTDNSVTPKNLRQDLLRILIKNQNNGKLMARFKLATFCSVAQCFTHWITTSCSVLLLHFIHQPMT